MGREIKFRAWHVKYKRWITDIYVSADGDLYEISNHKPDGSRSWGKVKPSEYVLLQYTGLTDKNGKEMYEGDIVIAYELNKKIVIEWQECGFIDLASRGSLSLEVIGNIFENPSLLKK
mgnify:CR=1 FL=1